MRLTTVVLTIVLLAAPPLQAFDGSGLRGAMLLAASNETRTEAPKVGSKAAAAKVKSEYGGKVLSVKLIGGKGPPVYRIKILSDSGVVKVVFVDGGSGKVFE